MLHFLQKVQEKQNEMRAAISDTLEPEQVIPEFTSLNLPVGAFFS